MITMHAIIIVGTNFHHSVKEESIKSNNIIRDTKYRDLEVLGWVNRY